MTAVPPPLLRLTALLVLVEAAGLVVLGLVYALRGVLSDAESVTGAELGALLIVGAGVLLGLAARGLVRARSWARSPVLVVQLLGALTALSLAQGRLWVAAAVTGALSLAVLGLLLAAPVRAALDPD